MLMSSKIAKLLAVELLISMERVNKKNIIDFLHLELIKLMTGIASW